MIKRKELKKNIREGLCEELRRQSKNKETGYIMDVFSCQIIIGGQ